MVQSLERRTFLGLAIVTIASGLAVHWYGVMLPAAARDVVGDTLWAMMIFWWLGAAVPRWPTGRRAAISLGVCWCVEFSQLYHSHLIDALRGGTVGHLILGSGFDARDLMSYGLGVAIAFWLESRLRVRE